MGKDIHVRILKYNKEENLYYEQKLFIYNKNKKDYEYISPYWNRNYEMFNGMKDGDEIDGYGEFPWSSLALNSYESEFKEEMMKKMKEIGYFDFFEISLAELKLYTLEHPVVTDYDTVNSEDFNTNKLTKTNPIIYLFETICNYLNFADWTFDFSSLSEYKVVFYFDA